MVICQKCNSKDVMVSNMIFALSKPEGVAVQKHIGNKYSFFCNNCESSWESDLNVEKDWLQYQWLRNKTNLEASDMGEGGSFEKGSTTRDDDLKEQYRLAKKIITSYKHTLDCSQSDWTNLEEDSKHA